jgi:hypothetical protein
VETTRSSFLNAAGVALAGGLGADVGDEFPRPLKTP